MTHRRALGRAAIAAATLSVVACGMEPPWTRRGPADADTAFAAAGQRGKETAGNGSEREASGASPRRPPVPITRGSDAEGEPGPSRGYGPAPAPDRARRSPGSDTTAGPDATSPVPDGVLLARRLGGAAGAAEVRRYWLYLPPSYDADASWPLLLYLHGSSLRGDDLDLVRKYGLPWLLERGEHIPFIVAAPQLPAGQRWVDTDRLAELLDTLQAELRVDPSRIYVTGFSMGAGGAWRVAEAMPDRLAAAVPIAATTPPPLERTVAALARVPIRVYHGDRDRDASYADAVAMVDAIRRAGGDAELITLRGEDHNVVNGVYGDSTLYRWFLSHRRDSGRTP